MTAGSPERTLLDRIGKVAHLVRVLRAMKLRATYGGWMWTTNNSRGIARSHKNQRRYENMTLSPTLCKIFYETPILPRLDHEPLSTEHLSEDCKSSIKFKRRCLFSRARRVVWSLWMQNRKRPITSRTGTGTIWGGRSPGFLLSTRVISTDDWRQRWVSPHPNLTSIEDAMFAGRASRVKACE